MVGGLPILQVCWCDLQSTVFGSLSRRSNTGSNVSWKYQPHHLILWRSGPNIIIAYCSLAHCTLWLEEKVNFKSLFLAAAVGPADIPTWAIAVMVVLGGVVLIITAILITSIACTVLRHSTWVLHNMPPLLCVCVCVCVYACLGVRNKCMLTSFCTAMTWPSGSSLIYSMGEYETLQSGCQVPKCKNDIEF